MIKTLSLQKVNFAKISKEPMVILPLRLWESIEEKMENLEVNNSKKLKKAITKSRKEIKKGKVVSLSQL